MELPHMSLSLARTHLESSFETVPFNDTEMHQLAEPVQACIRGLAEVRQNLRILNDHENFDAELAVQLHDSCSLPLAGAADLGYWRWLTINHARDLVEFRHGENAGLANYGIGRQWDNLLMRSWFRAELSRDETLEDPYSLTKRGGSDFWASGVVRHRYSSARNMVRDLVRFQFEIGDPLNGRLNTVRIRELYKRIRLIQASVSLELLTDAECDELLEELASDLV